MDPCSCSLVQMGCGASLTLDLSWFTGLHANCLSSGWEMPQAVAPLPFRGPLHPKISGKLAEVSAGVLSSWRRNISLPPTRLGTLLQAS